METKYQSQKILHIFFQIGISGGIKIKAGQLGTLKGKRHKGRRMRESNRGVSINKISYPLKNKS